MLKISRIKNIKIRNKYWAALFLIVIIGFVLRIYSLSSMDLYLDESIFYAFTKEFAEKGADTWTLAGMQPPFAIWTYSLPMGIFGFSNFSLRVSSAILGSLSIILVYYLCRLLYNSKNAFLAAFLIAISPLHVVYSRTAFADVIQAFFLISAIFLAEFCFRRVKRNRIIFIITSGILFSFAYLVKYNTLIVFGLYWLFKVAYPFFKKDKAYKNNFYWMIISSMTAFFASVMIIFATGGFPGVVYLANSSIASALLQYNLLLNPVHYFILALFDALSPVLFILLPISIVFLLFHKKKNESDYFILYMIIFYILLITFQGRRFPRYYILILPFIVMLFSRFVMLLANKSAYRRRYAAIIMSIMVLSSFGWSIYEVNKNLNFNLWSEAGKYVKENYPNARVHGSLHKGRLILFYVDKDADNSESISTLKKGDLVLFTWINKTSGILGNSPWEDNIFFYHNKRVEVVPEFQRYVLENSELVKKFDYKGNTAIWLFKVVKLPPYEKDTRNADYDVNFNFFGLWNVFCDSYWNKGSTLKSIMLKPLSSVQTDAINLKCSSI